jgi:superfamily II DNA helicase RecQ
MQIKIFTIPAMDAQGMTEEMNAFLRGVRVLEIKKELVRLDDGTFWSFCITYLPVNPFPRENVVGGGVNRKEKVDYKQILPEDVFVRFERMRRIRKQLADAEAIPAYAVFTDSELAEIAKSDSLTTSSLKSVPGVGTKKVEKYGADFCRLFNELSKQEDNETSGESVESSR